MRHRIRLPLFALIAGVLTVSSASAQLMSAYIDRYRGVIIGVGEAEKNPNESGVNLKLRAVENAKKNIILILERENLTEDQTIGQYLATNPDRRAVFQSFIDSAEVINEDTSRPGMISVTLSLPIGGDRGFSGIKDWFLGKRANAPAFIYAGSTSTKTTSESIKNELKNTTEPKRIALFQFDDKTGFSGLDLSKEVYMRLRARFKRDHRFILLSQEESEAILDSNDTSTSELLNMAVNDRVKIEGGADGVVLGVISQYEPKIKKKGIGGAGYLEIDFDVTIDLRILNTETGKWAYYDQVYVSASDRSFTLKSADDADKVIEINNIDSDNGLAAKTFSQSLDRVEGAVRAAFPVEGYILKVMGDRVYINLTRMDGVKEDTTLTIIRLGDMLVDPVTGDNIDQIRDKIGTIKVVDVKDTYSQAIIEEIIQPVQEGDIVTFK